VNGSSQSNWVISLRINLDVWIQKIGSFRLRNVNWKVVLVCLPLDLLPEIVFRGPLLPPVMPRSILLHTSKLIYNIPFILFLSKIHPCFYLSWFYSMFSLRSKPFPAGRVNISSKHCNTQTQTARTLSDHATGVTVCLRSRRRWAPTYWCIKDEPSRVESHILTISSFCFSTLKKIKKIK
jgi:hypothetical protein